MSSKLGRISFLIREYAESVGCGIQESKTEFTDGKDRKVKLIEVVSSKSPVIILVSDSKTGRVSLKESDEINSLEE